MKSKNKEALRKHYQKIRQNLSLARREEASINVLKVLRNLVQNYKNVLSFTNKKEEIDISQLNNLLSSENRLFLPKVISNNLKIFQVSDLSGLILNTHYFIYEPDSHKCPMVEEQLIDLVLVPGIVFDKENNRLGFGKGYYDKLLARMPNSIKIGIGFLEQLYPEYLPIEETDIRLNDVYLF
jgi:5-formyltetrahydrofolate cyclo-ligase